MLFYWDGEGAVEWPTEVVPFLFAFYSSRKQNKRGEDVFAWAGQSSFGQHIRGMDGLVICLCRTSSNNFFFAARTREERGGEREP